MEISKNNSILSDWLLKPTASCSVPLFLSVFDTDTDSYHLCMIAQNDDASDSQSEFSSIIHVSPFSYAYDSRTEECIGRVKKSICVLDIHASQ